MKYLKNQHKYQTFKSPGGRTGGSPGTKTNSFLVLLKKYRDKNGLPGKSPPAAYFCTVIPVKQHQSLPALTARKCPIR